MKTMSIEELKNYAEENPVEWLVDDILKQASFNILAAGPKAGKSTFARQLAVAVSKGEPFLGETTKQGEVLYICPDEPDATELYRSFCLLGATLGVHVSCSPVNRSTLVSDMRAVIARYPAVRLVVLDTLERCVELEDLNDYVQTLKDLGPLADFAAENKLTVVALHHTNKRQATSVAGALMGSNGLASLSTTTIELLVDHAGKRFIRTMQRYGREIERTELHFDRLRGVSTLGKSETEKSAEKSIHKVSDTRKQIIDFIAKNPGTTQQQIIENVSASTRNINHELKTLVRDKIIRTTGTGRKGSPYLYSPIDIQTDKPCYTESVGHAA